MGLGRCRRRGRSAAQLSLGLQSWPGAPKWHKVLGSARMAAASAIREAGTKAPDYLQVMTRMRSAYESGRRRKAFRGEDTDAVMRRLARSAVGLSAGKKKAPSRAKPSSAAKPRRHSAASTAESTETGNRNPSSR